MLLQQLKVLFLKRFLPVMFTLILDALNNLRDLRLAYRNAP